MMIGRLSIYITRLIIIEIQTIAKFLINPILYIFIGLIWLIIKLKSQRKYIILLTIYLYITGIPLTGELFSSVWKLNNTFQPDKVYDAVLVLTGAIDYDWYINKKVDDSLVFDFKSYYKFTGAEERIFTGIEFVRMGKAKTLLYGKWTPTISINGKYDSLNCSELIKKFAMENGVSEEKFIIYGKNIRRTIDEANQLKEFLIQHPIKNILLVTSEIHMRRANAIFNKKEIYPDLYSVSRTAPIYKKIFKVKNYIPSPLGFTLSMNSLYELVGFCGYLIKDDI